MYANEINLGFIESTSFLLVSLILLIKVGPEIFVGMFYSFSHWRRTITIFGIAHTYVLLIMMVLALIFYIKKNKGISLPNNNHWIILWVSIWWLWTLFVLTLYNFESKIIVYRDLLSIVIAPLLFIIIISKDIDRIKRFAFSFVVTSIIGGFVALDIVNVPFSTLFTDPSIMRFGVLGVGNYHAFSQMFMISIFFLFTFLLVSKQTLVRFSLIFASCVCLFFLLLGGSRQSIGGAIPPFLLFLVWAWNLKEKNKYRVLVLGFLTISLAIFLLNLSPSLVIRNLTHYYAIDTKVDSNFFDAFNLINDRGALWVKGLKMFLVSPIWGVGYESYFLSHNIFIGLLVNEGIVGFSFLLGFIVFLRKVTRGFWKGSGNYQFDVWRIALICIVLYAFVTGMASGTQISLWHLWWGGALLWGLNDLYILERKKQKKNVNGQLKPSVGVSPKMEMEDKYANI